MRYKIRLDTMADINRFVGIATKYSGKIALTDGDNFTVNGKDYPIGYSLFEDNYEYEKDFIYPGIDYPFFDCLCR